MKTLRIRNKLYIAASLLGISVCVLKILPTKTYLVDKLNSDALIMLLCGLCLYIAGYCLYRAVMAISQYFAFSDLR